MALFFLGSDDDSVGISSTIHRRIDPVRLSTNVANQRVHASTHFCRPTHIKALMKLTLAAPEGEVLGQHS